MRFLQVLLAVLDAPLCYTRGIERVILIFCAVCVGRYCIWPGGRSQILLGRKGVGLSTSSPLLCCQQNYVSIKPCNTFLVELFLLVHIRIDCSLYCDRSQCTASVNVGLMPVHVECQNVVLLNTTTLGFWFYLWNNLQCALFLAILLAYFVIQKYALLIIICLQGSFGSVSSDILVHISSKEKDSITHKLAASRRYYEKVVYDRVLVLCRR